MHLTLSGIHRNEGDHTTEQARLLAALERAGSTEGSYHVNPDRTFRSTTTEVDHRAIEMGDAPRLLEAVRNARAEIHSCALGERPSQEGLWVVTAIVSDIELPERFKDVGELVCALAADARLLLSHITATTPPERGSTTMIGLQTEPREKLGRITPRRWAEEIGATLKHILAELEFRISEDTLCVATCSKVREPLQPWQ